MLLRVSRAMAMLAVLAAAPARADEEVVELRYSAPPGCPTRAVFEAAILERTQNVRVGAPAQRVFAVTIEAAGDGFRGALVVDQIADKELTAQGCDDLATALALVTALAIDPTATVAPRPRESRARWSLEADVDAMIAAGVGPGALFAAVLEGRLVRRAYQLEVAAIAGRDTAEQADGRARFTWLAARVAGCRRWRVRGVAVDGCGHLEAGAVRATGEMIINQRDLTRLWLAAGAHAGARYPLGTRIFGLLQVGASVPFIRDRYIFAPNVAIHETPIATAWLVLGVGLRFP